MIKSCSPALTLVPLIMGCQEFMELPRLTRNSQDILDNTHRCTNGFTNLILPHPRVIGAAEVLFRPFAKYPFRILLP